MLIIKFVLKFLKILNRDATPQQIAGGIALGSIAGITPLANLHNLGVLFLVIIIRVNMSSALLGLALFSAIGYLLDPLSNRIGYALLVEAEFLAPFWTLLYNTPVVPWTAFNDTLVLGSLVVSLVLFAPIYFLLVWAVRKYREKLMAAVTKWKIVTILKSSKLYGLYQTFS